MFTGLLLNAYPYTLEGVFSASLIQVAAQSVGAHPLGLAASIANSLPEVQVVPSNMSLVLRGVLIPAPQTDVLQTCLAGGCTRDSYDRGWGDLPTGCPEGMEFFRGLCYKKCWQNWQYGVYGK